MGIICYWPFVRRYCSNICFSWQHRCVTHLYRIPLRIGVANALPETCKKFNDRAGK